MIIRKLTADFGTLRGRTLELQPGLNIITLPNEGGKSTWTAFLTAMLYGLASGERTTKTALSTKEHYQPWSGIPMAGQLVLEWQGRRVLLQRSGTKRQPLGSVQARDPDTGEPIPELCREDCGLVLLGVERAVFERSALIGQGKLPLTAAPELERRLTACVTGDEEAGSAQALKRLQDWQKDRSSPRKVGRLDQARQEAAALEQELAAQQSLTDQARVLEKQLEEAQSRLDSCQQEKLALERRNQALLYQTCQDAMTQAQEAEARLSALEDTALPEAGTLSALQARLHELEASLPPAVSSLPEAPATPPPFRDLHPDQATDQAREDARRVRELQGKRTAPWLLPAGIILALLGLVCLGLGTALSNSPPDSPAPLLLGGAGLLAGLGLLGGALWSRRRTKAAQSEAQTLLDRYTARSPEDLPALAQHWQGNLAAYEARRTDHAAQIRQRQTWEAALSRLEQDLAPLGAVHGLEQCRQAIQTALDRRHALDLARQEARSAQENWERLAPLMPKEPQTVSQLPAIRDPKALEAALLQAQQQVQNLQTNLAAMKARGLSPEQLEAGQQHLAALRREITALDREYQAVTLAIQALQQAQLSLQARFAPALAAQAGEILAQLTGGRYGRLSLDRSMAPSVQEQGQVLARSSLWLSGGTADQVFLAVRLALCRQLLPPDTPILLDDALVNFDDARLEAVLRWLGQEGARRQILLFTCQGREQALWNRLHQANT